MYAEELKKAVQHDFQPNIVKEWAYQENMSAKSPWEEPHFQLNAMLGRCRRTTLCIRDKSLNLYLNFTK